MGVVGQALEHLINEGQREVVLAGRRIELAVVDAHPPPSSGSHLDSPAVSAPRMAMPSMPEATPETTMPPHLAIW